ncbi:MAG: TIGR04053 family radical SAM/SPASM domain-containing protein [Gemmatimonadetes bacterium]|nr:TIGR04053 family radical SAM/SPASM domain-containing protein [Gemmatimonadota bacterium]
MAAAPKPADLDFGEAPHIVIWETTRACDLACLHCRAEAVRWRDLRELSTLEAMALMNRIRQFGRPLFVLSGGDPAKRPDLVELVEHGARIGLRMALTPSGTPLMTPELMTRLKAAGLSRLAVSLDGSTAEIHDAFRGVSGSHGWTLRILGGARALGLPIQVNTTVTRRNLTDFDDLCVLMTELEIALWSVFFLVPTGRARPADLVSAEEFEAVFHRMYDLSRTAPFDIKSTAAPQYRRVILQRQVQERRAGGRTEPPIPLTGGSGFSRADGERPAKGGNDGDGFLFISHTGEIYPSGFLPVSAGNVRTHDIVDVYRDSPLFRELRDRTRLKGKCSACEYRRICGGSRARAYALTGDWLEADPCCAHIPAQRRSLTEAGATEPATL